MGASTGCCFCWKLWGQRGFCQCFTSLWMTVWNCSKKCDSWLSRQVLQVKLSVYFNISGILQCVSHGQKERGKLLLRHEHSHRIVLKELSSCEPHASIHCPLPGQTIPAGNSCWASSHPCVHLTVDLYWYQMSMLKLNDNLKLKDIQLMSSNHLPTEGRERNPLSKTKNSAGTSGTQDCKEGFCTGDWEYTVNLLHL